MKNNIYVISNDKIYRDKDNNLYGPNNDLDNILHSLKSKFKVHLIARKTSIKNTTSNNRCRSREGNKRDNQSTISIIRVMMLTQ